MFSVRCLGLPAGSSHVSDLHVEEGQEGVSTEGTGGVQVGVVGRPAGHDLLVVHEAVARLTARTAGDQQLETHNLHIKAFRIKPLILVKTTDSASVHFIFYLHGVVVEDAGVAGVVRGTQVRLVREARGGEERA